MSAVRTNFAAALAVAVATSSILPVHAGPALSSTGCSDTEITVGCASVTISGEGSGYVEISVPRDLAIANGDKVTVDAEGAFTGMALVPAHFDGGAPIAFEGIVEPGSEYPRPVWVPTRFERADASSFLLPAGDYRLYLLTDGPASASMTLPGSGVSLNLEVATLLPAGASDVAYVAPDVSLGDPTPTFSGGRPVNPQGGPHVRFGALLNYGQLGTVFSAGRCVYPSPPERYVSHCPTHPEAERIFFNTNDPNPLSPSSMVYSLSDTVVDVPNVYAEGRYITGAGLYSPRLLMGTFYLDEEA